MAIDVTVLRVFTDQDGRFGNPLGVLAIASTDANYFRSSMGTLFLGYIAEVLNRLLPKHLKGF